MQFAIFRSDRGGSRLYANPLNRGGGTLKATLPEISAREEEKLAKSGN